MKKIMIINSGWEQVDLISTARNTGLYIIATDAAPNAPGFSLADETYVVEPRNLTDLLILAREKKIDAVAADQCDYSYYAAAFIAEVMDLPGPGLAVAQKSTNKKWMRQACSQAGITQPRYLACKTEREAQEAAKLIGFPCIIKPVDNRGNFGVNRVDEVSQIKDAFYEAIGNSHSRECLLEEYIEGTMITVDGYAFGEKNHKSLAVASKVMLGGRKRVAMEIEYPARVASQVIVALRLNHERVAEALGVCAGCTHGEYMLTGDDQIYLIECANRGGGCFTSSRIVPAVSGCDLSQLLILQALGQKVSPREDFGEMKAAAVMSFFELSPGRVLSFENLDDIKADQDILAFRLAVQPGGLIQSITNDANRHGFVIARGATVDLAREKAAEMKKKLVVRYDF